MLYARVSPNDVEQEALGNSIGSIGKEMHISIAVARERGEGVGGVEYVCVCV